MDNIPNEIITKGIDLDSLSKTKSQNFAKIPSKKNKGKDISHDIVLNFKYDDFEPIGNKYQPYYKKHHGKIYYENVDILDQNRYKFILNMEDLGGGGLENSKKPKESYSKYSQKNNSNIRWEDINTIIYYSVDFYTCPICLEKTLLCPQMTRCGHIFCWPCLISYYDYWTVSAVAKKIPKCPLCQEQLNLNNTKFCEILNCVNYLSCSDEGNNNSHHQIEKEAPNKDKLQPSSTSSYQTHFITFNLILKDKKAPVLYNTFYDPYLEYYKKHLNTEAIFNFVPLETDEAFSFSRIFVTTPELTLRRYNKIKHELEGAMREELDSFSDERKIKSLDKCIEEIGEEIKFISTLVKNRGNNEEDKFDENEYKSEENEDEINIDVSKNIMQPERSISNNENQSTIDDDLHKQENIDYNNFIYFYQEQFGDIYYLHPIDYSILLTEYGSEEHLPTEITVRIILANKFF